MPHFVNHFCSDFRILLFCTKTEKISYNSLTGKHLTFSRGHDRLWEDKEKAVTKTVWLRYFQRVGIWCKPIMQCHKTHHFRAGKLNATQQAFPSARVKG